MSVEVEMFTLIIFHKIKENIRSDNKEWIQAHTKLIRLCMRLFLILPVGKKKQFNLANNRRCEIFSVNLDLL